MTRSTSYLSIVALGATALVVGAILQQQQQHRKTPVSDDDDDEPTEESVIRREVVTTTKTDVNVQEHVSTPRLTLEEKVNLVVVAAATDDAKVVVDEQQQDTVSSFTFHPIGTVHSVYRLCVGTPRQGLLAPHARGHIELTAVPLDAVAGLEGFSHIWVIFCFHLNTLPKKESKQPSKVAPPALGGVKVGVLATRSPHRPNPIGMTLCKLDRIRTRNNVHVTILEVSGLDLVDGTPVLDIKPYVPHYDTSDGHYLGSNTILPSWVADGLETRRKVTISTLAREQLLAILQANPKALAFYGPHRGDMSEDDTFHQVIKCMEEVLSIDVRSSWQTQKARKGKSQAERANRVKQVMAAAAGGGGDDNPVPHVDHHIMDDEEEICTQQIDNLLLHFTVVEQHIEQQLRTTSQGSGAEDTVHVKSIRFIGSTDTAVDEDDEEEEAFVDETVVDETVVDEAVVDETVEKEHSQTPDHVQTEKGLDVSEASQAQPIVDSTDAASTEASSAPEGASPSSETPATVETAEKPLSVVTDSKEDAPSSTEAATTVGTTQEALPAVASTPVVAPTATTVEPPQEPPPSSVEKSKPPPAHPAPKQDAEQIEDASYKKLKSYWSRQASQNTPTGLVPVNPVSTVPTRDKFFVFSDKPVRVKVGMNDKNGPRSPARNFRSGTVTPPISNVSTDDKSVGSVEPIVVAPTTTTASAPESDVKPAEKETKVEVTSADAPKVENEAFVNPLGTTEDAQGSEKIESSDAKPATESNEEVPTSTPATEIVQTIAPQTETSSDASQPSVEFEAAKTTTTESTDNTASTTVAQDKSVPAEKVPASAVDRVTQEPAIKATASGIEVADQPLETTAASEQKIEVVNVPEATDVTINPETPAGTERSLEITSPATGLGDTEVASEKPDESTEEPATNEQSVDEAKDIGTVNITAVANGTPTPEKQSTDESTPPNGHTAANENVSSNTEATSQVLASEPGMEVEGSEAAPVAEVKEDVATADNGTSSVDVQDGQVEIKENGTSKVVDASTKSDHDTPAVPTDMPAEVSAPLEVSEQHDEPTVATTPSEDAVDSVLVSASEDTTERDDDAEDAPFDATVSPTLSNSSESKKRRKRKKNKK